MMFLLDACTSAAVMTNGWFLVATAGALAVMAVLALIYAIAPLAGRNELRPWARIKIFDVLFSIVLIFIFFFIITELNSINYVNLFGSSLVPTACISSLTSASTSGTLSCSHVLPAVAMCDLNQFNGYAGKFNILAYLIQFFLSTSSGLNIGNEGNWGSYGAVISINISSFQNFLFLSILFWLYILSRVLLLLLSVSTLLLSLTLTIGLLARIFPVTRTFGGAMIAFGMGIGIILPLMVSLTYGYLDIGLQNTFSNISTQTLINTIYSFLLYALIPIASTIALTQEAISLIINLIVFSGLVIVGLAFVSIFDLVIVDVFIRDFSQAVGERLDLLSILMSVA
ncbi:MAG: hypothetical protein ACP5IK_00905 [Candidatus Micrarchaeia archaeon]